MPKSYIDLEKEDWDGLVDRLDQAETRLSVIEKQYDTAFKALRDEQAVQDATLNQLSLDRTAQGKRLTAVEARTDDSATKVAGLLSWKLSADATMNAAEKTANDLKGQLAQASALIGELDTRLDKAEPVLVALSTRLDQNDANDRGQDSTDSAFDARAKLLEAYKAEVSKTLSDYAARLAKLEQPPVPPEPSGADVAPADAP